MLVQSQKGIVHLGLLILLLLGLVAGVYLVQQQQIFKSKATGDLIWLVDENGNRLSPKDGDIFEVDKPQIRIKINQPDWSSQPQGSLPNLVTVAYAQSSQCNGTVYSCSDIKCDDGITIAPGTGCYETGGDPNNRYQTECKRNCTASNIQPTPTPVATKGITCESINGQCGDSEWKLRGSGATCSSINRSYKGYNDGDNYTDCDTLQEQYPYCYTGCETAGGAALTTGTCRDLRPDEAVRPPTDPEPVDSSKYIWKADCSRPCTRNSNCPQIDNGINPVTSNWCYGFEGGERCLQLQSIGTPRGGEAPAAQPTEAQPVPTEEETTQSVRISLNPASIQKDGSCSESLDPAQACTEVSVFDLGSKGNIIDWQLPSQAGTYPIYVGFISNKGGYKDAVVTVTYKSKSQTISGKLKIKANGQRYKDVWVTIRKITKEDPIEYETVTDLRNFDFSNQLPTDQDQEVNYVFSNLTDSKYALVPNLTTEDGKHIGALSSKICPDSPAGPYECLVNTGATDANLTLEIPPDGQATPTEEAVSLKVSLYLEGIDKNSHPLHPQRDLDLTIISGTNTFKKSVRVEFKPSGGYFAGEVKVERSKLTPNIFFIAKPKGYLRLGASFYTSYLSSWRAGDVNDDNIINEADWNIVSKQCFGDKFNTPACVYKDTADVNDDGKVDTTDANLVTANLGKRGT